MNKKRDRSGFTLIELMVVIVIVGILASVSTPILRGRIEQAKWSEGAATAGTIKTAVRISYAENPSVAGAWRNQAVSGVAATLGFYAGDLTGMYFTVENFTITSVDANGNAVIAVSAPTGLTGSGVLGAAGWIYTP
ncbi:MAG: prepilin-type N-terminal cleavage/methylation domain-containing protein [Planctomycetota bacterium]|jgi:type IV pilus assembly protein PilA